MDNVIQIGDFSLIRKRERGSKFWRKPDDCMHTSLEIDDDGHVVKCRTCGVQVEAYWALRTLAERYNESLKTVESKRDQLREDMAKGLTLKAAQRVEKAWRSRSMVPCCPHCGAGIRASDGFGSSLVNVKIDDRRRTAKASTPTPEGGG
jgi:hypothetical protein